MPNREMGAGWPATGPARRGGAEVLSPGPLAILTDEDSAQLDNPDLPSRTLDDFQGAVDLRGRVGRHQAGADPG